MDKHQRLRRFYAALLVNGCIFAAIFLLVIVFWQKICAGSLSACLGDNKILQMPNFLLLATIRPLVFTPISLLPAIAGGNFGVWWGGLISAVSSIVSALYVYWFARLIGKYFIKSWLRRNLPSAYSLIKSQDGKIIIILRLFPLAYFDLCSFLFGLLSFRFKRFLLLTFIGVLPESFLISYFANAEISTWQKLALIITTTFSVWLLVLGIFYAYEYLRQRKKIGLFGRIRAAYKEILLELQESNEIIRRREFTSQKEPILLLYGFFSSRNCFTVLERMLATKGYDVLCFNLGGLFDAFFTEGVTESAELVDSKLQSLFAKHNFNKINIVAHSKGGLVAMWWLLQMGGWRYCNKLITMGTPFRGSKLTYIGLLTPFAFFWRDIWQMRPNSSFLRQLQACALPDSIEVHCIYSQNDRVTHGTGGIFTPQTGRVASVPMHHVKHLEFPYRYDVAATISGIIGS